MYYFSELKNKKVFTDKMDNIGHLEDLIFLASLNPKITKLVIHTKLGNKLIIPVSYLLRVNSRIVINSDYQETDLVENELYILKNILDKQIIDLKGNKVVRVNDIIIQDKPFLMITGVDIGLRGILRWFKLEGFITKLYDFVKIVGIEVPRNTLSWADIQPLELERGKVVIKQEAEKLNKIRPEDLAYYLDKTNIQNTRKFLRLLDEKVAATVIGELNLNYQIDLIRNFSPEKATAVLSYIDPDEAADILLALSQRRRETIINSLPPDKQKELKYLLLLSKTPIGGFITTKFITVSPEDNVQSVISKIKKETFDFKTLNYIYVTNSQNQLVGVFSLHELLLQEFTTQVIKFMIPNVIVIHLTTSEEIAVNKMLKYKIYSLPVIDKNKELMGIINFDDISDVILKRLI